MNSVPKCTRKCSENKVCLKKLKKDKENAFRVKEQT